MSESHILNNVNPWWSLYWLQLSRQNACEYKQTCQSCVAALWSVVLPPHKQQVETQTSQTGVRSRNVCVMVSYTRWCFCKTSPNLTSEEVLIVLMMLQTWIHSHHWKRRLALDRCVCERPDSSHWCVKGPNVHIWSHSRANGWQASARPSKWPCPQDNTRPDHHSVNTHTHVHL